MMDAAMAEKQTADGWRVALHADICEALNYMSIDELHDVVSFAITEYIREAAIQRAAALQQIRDDYKQALRDFRSGNYYRVPEWLNSHCWDVRNHVAEMGLPDHLQYHPITDVLAMRRDERVAYCNDLG